jgi:hypothetical protein
MPIAQWLGLAIPGPGQLSPKRIAEDAKDVFVADNKWGKFAPTSGFTFGDACEAWMHYGKTDRDVRRSTATSYRNVVTVHLRPRSPRTRRSSRSRRPGSRRTARAC